MEFVWTDTAERRLIENVKIRPIVWKMMDRLGASADVRKREWNIIGAIVGCDGPTAEYQFTIMKRRYAYYKKSRKIRGNEPRSTRGRPCTWLADRMQFLDDDASAVVHGFSVLSSSSPLPAIDLNVTNNECLKTEPIDDDDDASTSYTNVTDASHDDASDGNLKAEFMNASNDQSSQSISNCNSHQTADGESMKFDWSVSAEELLVKNVKARPCLWDKMHRQYYNHDIAEQKWKRIGEIIGCNRVTAEHQFNNIKRRYKRYKAIRVARQVAGEPPRKAGRPEMLLADQMSFLDNSDQKLNVPDNDEMDNDANTNASSSSSVISVNAADPLSVFTEELAVAESLVDDPPSMFNISEIVSLSDAGAAAELAAKAAAAAQEAAAATTSAAAADAYRKASAAAASASAKLVAAAQALISISNSVIEALAAASAAANVVAEKL